MFHRILIIAKVLVYNKWFDVCMSVQYKHFL